MNKNLFSVRIEHNGIDAIPTLHQAPVVAVVDDIGMQKIVASPTIQTVAAAPAHQHVVLIIPRQHITERSAPNLLNVHESQLTDLRWVEPRADTACCERKNNTTFGYKAEGYFVEGQGISTRAAIHGVFVYRIEKQVVTITP